MPIDDFEIPAIKKESLLRDLKRPGQGWWGYMVYRTTYGDEQAWQEFKNQV
jgi:hypothetical protein